MLCNMRKKIWRDSFEEAGQKKAKEINYLIWGKGKFYLL